MTLATSESVEDFDLVILGSGEAGKYLAWTFGKQGKRVALIERQYIGGSCPNIACLPSKNIIHSAKIASYFARGEEFGIKHGDYSVDMPGVRERKRKMVAGLVEIHRKNFEASKTDLVLGSGRFIAPKTLRVELNEGGTRTLRGDSVVISTGTTAAIPDIPGLREAQPLTHIGALELDEIPQHLIILGGGFIGLEFAQAMRRFGSEVTIMDRNDRLLHDEDPDISEALHQLLKDDGITIVTGAQILGVEGRSGERVKIDCLKGGFECLTEGTHLLVATGRTPNTHDIGLDVAGVELRADGYIRANARLETTAPGVWAVGECAGSPQFTHAVFDDFRVVRDNMLGGNHVTTGRQMPLCLFTDPEYARIGLSETQAKAADVPYRLASLPMAADLRTRTLSETRGFMKVLVASDSDSILGFTAFGVDGGEIMGAVQLAMLGGMPYTAIRDAVLAHPTLMEGLVSLFTNVPERKEMLDG